MEAHYTKFCDIALTNTRLITNIKINKINKIINTEHIKIRFILTKFFFHTQKMKETNSIQV